MIFILFLIFFYTNFFAYSHWNNTIAGQSSYFIIFYLIFYIIRNKKLICKKQLLFSSYVKYLILIPIISLFSSYFIYEQSPIDSMKALSPHFLWLFYYYCHIKELKEQDIIKVFLIVSIFILGIQIIQQFITPIFGISYDKTGNIYIDIRNGIQRYRVSFYGLFTFLILYYYWELIRQKRKVIYLCIFTLMIVSIYLTLTRQLIFALIIILLISTIFNSGTKYQKITSLSMLLGFIIISYFYSDSLFGSFIDMTIEQSGNEDIRILAAEYYTQKLIDNPITFLIGNGTPAGNSAYANLTIYEQQELGFHTSDVGIIGVTYKYGIFYAAIFYLIIYKIYYKHRKKIPSYLLMYGGTFLITSIMIYPIYSNISYIVWSCIFYITDKKLQKNERISSNYNCNTCI